MMVPKKAAHTAVWLALTLVLAACAKKEEAAEVAAAPAHADKTFNRDSPSAAPAAPVMSMKPAAEPVAETAVTAVTAAQQMGSRAVTYVDGERKFIRKANARFSVKDVYAAAESIEDSVAAHGGFVVKNDIAATSINRESHSIGNGKLLELNEYKVQGQLTVRVPSARTQEFLRAIVGHIVFLDQRNFSAHDAQFDLLRSQLDAIRNQETQTDLGAAITQGGKLGQRAEAITTRGEIKAERDGALLAKKEFEDQVAFSTIELTLYQPSKVLQSEKVDIESVFLKSRPGFFSRLGEKLGGGWNGLLDFVLALVGIWPVLVFGAVVAAVAWRISRRKAKA